MTHKDIYTKFMIEYDKANVTSSYPSLTEYEVATLLDKAYNALIAQKVTGNNPRRAPFEADNKAIADVAPLIEHKDLELRRDGHAPAINIVLYELPDDFMYYVSSALNQRMISNSTDAETDIIGRFPIYFGKREENVNYQDGIPYDGDLYRLVPMKLVTHLIAEKFFNTPYNMPWVKIPVTYAEGNSMFVVYDPVLKPMIDSTAHLSYIKKPASFVKSLVKAEIEDPGNNPLDNPVNPPINSNFILDISRLDSNDRIQ